MTELASNLMIRWIKSIWILTSLVSFLILGLMWFFVPVVDGFMFGITCLSVAIVNILFGLITNRVTRNMVTSVKLQTDGLTLYNLEDSIFIPFTNITSVFENKNSSMIRGLRLPNIIITTTEPVWNKTTVRFYAKDSAQAIIEELQKHLTVS